MEPKILDHMIFVTTTQVCHCGTKAAIDKHKQMSMAVFQYNLIYKNGRGPKLANPTWNQCSFRKTGEVAFDFLNGQPTQN